MANEAEPSPLYGSCSCGRNQFLIILPSDPALVRQKFEVVVDDSAEGREWLVPFISLTFREGEVGVRMQCLTMGGLAREF